MAQAGTKGQTNVTQSDSSGNQKMDISPIDTINNDMPLEDIQGLYTNLAHQYEGIVSKAAQDVGNRQTARIGNDFGAVSPYNYNQYYEPAANDFQSGMRVEGTQRALSEGMSRAKKEAEAKAAAAQQNYNNAQTTLEELENAKQNFQLVEASKIGGNTSAQELLQYAESLESGDTNTKIRDTMATYLSDKIVGKNPESWNIPEIRSQATAETLAKFGMTDAQYNNMSEEERQAFWDRGDVGAYWTNRYTTEFAKTHFSNGEEMAKKYQEAYDYNYKIIKNVLDGIKDASEYFNESVPSYADTIRINNVKFDELDTSYDAATNTYKVGSNTYYFDDEKSENAGKVNEKGEIPISAAVTPEQRQIIKQASLAIYAKMAEAKKAPDFFGQKASLEGEVKEMFKQLSEFIRQAIVDGPMAPKEAIEKRTLDVVNDGGHDGKSGAADLIESAVGADLESIYYLNDMRRENPQQYDNLMHDYALVATYGEVFEIADGETTYHTAGGDKKLDKGTFVMYTLPGFQDANGEINDPNLKKYVELRKQQFSATADDEKLNKELEDALTGYKRVVLASLTLAANHDCDVTADIVHAAIYAANPSSSDAKKDAIFNGHTVEEVLSKFGELADKDGEKAYSIFTKIINKAASVGGSMFANYAGKLTVVNNKDEKGRNMVGSELVGSKDVNTLFDNGDLDNMTVEQASALWTTIATSIDQYNNGSQTGNIKSDFLTADGLNWWNMTGIEIVKGLTGIVDLVGNGLWAVFGSAAVIADGVTSGRGVSGDDFDRMIKTPRWGTGGITGNWSGANSPYAQFAGDYNENAFGYGESNQWRMTNNLTHLVNPILADIWFKEASNDDIKALGEGRMGDEGFNYRSVMKATSSLAGLVGGVVAGNYIAKGIAAVAGTLANVAHKTAAAAATGIKAGFARTMVVNASKVAEGLLKGTAKVAGVLGSSSKADDTARIGSAAIDHADDVARIAGMYTDDAARAAAGSADDVVRGAASTVDDAARKASGVTDDVLEISDRAHIYADIQENIRAQQEVLKVWAGAADDTTRMLGTAATSITANTLDDISNQVISYAKSTWKAIMGPAYDDAAESALTTIMGPVAKGVSKRAFGIAHLSSFSGLPVQSLDDLSDDAVTIFSNLAHASQGGKTATKVPKDLVNYINSLSKKQLTSQLTDLANRASWAAKAGRSFTMKDTIRFLARNGWDSKRINLLIQDWLKDQLQDLTTDILYGYIKPEVTNEGTDRETIDEYLTNPMNYVMNLAASGIQFIGGRVINNALQGHTMSKLEKAQKALELARQTGNEELVAKKATKTIKLVDRMNRLTDKALERGRSIEDMKTISKQVDAIGDDAIATLDNGAIRSMSPRQIASMSKNSVSFRTAMADSLDPAHELFMRQNAGIPRAMANHVRFQKELGCDITGVGTISNVSTNIGLWRAFFDGRTKALKELNIPQGNVTIAQQRKIYDAMIDDAVEKYGKTIPGLRTSLNHYFDNLLDQAKNGGFEQMRAGYLPIESMLNTNKDVVPAIRGFGNGSNVLDPASANPYLERSEFLSDVAIVDAIEKGETTIELKDVDGNPIVNDAGVVEVRDLNPDGLNLLDSMTNSANAKMLHDYIDPIVGGRPAEAGAAAIKNGYVAVNQKGAMEAAIRKGIKDDEADLKNLENTILYGDKAKRENTRVKKQAEIRAQKIADDNPYIKRAMTQKAVADNIAKDKVAEFTARKTDLTEAQRQMPAVIMGYTNKFGAIDAEAGYTVFNRYKQIVKNDIKKFQNGEISVGDTLDTPMYRFDKYAWEYGNSGPNPLFGAEEVGYKHSVVVDANYYDLLNEYSASGMTEPSKDMVMKRLVETQKVEPKNAKGEIFSSVSEKTGKKYDWESPLKYFRSSNITGDATANMELRAFQRRGMGGTKAELGWSYPGMDASQFDKLVLDSPANISKAKDILIYNLMEDNAIPYTGTGKNKIPVKTAKNMIDEATNAFVNRMRGGGKDDFAKVGSKFDIAPTFQEYVEEMSTVLAEKSTFAKAFDKTSPYYGIYQQLNSMENSGVTFESFREYLNNKINAAAAKGEDFDDLTKAYAVWCSIEDTSYRQIGLGDDFETNVANSSRDVIDEADDTPFDLLDNSSEAVLQNSRNADLNPAAFARKNEILEKGVKASEATAEEQLDYLGTQYGGRAKKYQNQLDLMRSSVSTPEALQDALGSLKREMDIYTSGDKYLTEYNNRKAIVKTLGGKGKNPGLIDDANELIKEAGTANKNVQSRIDRYASQRKHRQEAYGVIVSDTNGKNDALHAFGATSIDDGYSVVKNPTQYRAAKRNVDIYRQHANELDGLEKEFADAVDKYRVALAEKKKAEQMLGKGASKAENDNLQALYDKANKAALTAQGLVDETRKTFSQKLDDYGMDLTEGFEHNADWSGSALAYDKMMIRGGSIEGKIDQSIEALKAVQNELVSSSKNDVSQLYAKIQTKISELEAVKEKVPSYETEAAKGLRQSGQRTSMENALSATMAKTIYGDGLEQSSRYMVNPDGTYTVVATRPTNNMFTDQQLNSIASISKERGESVRTGASGDRLNYTMKDGKPVYTPANAIDYGKTAVDYAYKNTDGKKVTAKNVTYQRYAGLDDEVQEIDIFKDGQTMDIAKAPAAEIAAFNAAAMEGKGSPYRLGIVADKASDIEKPLTKEFSYGKDQPKFEKLNAANDKAQAVYKYKQMEAEVTQINKQNLDLKDYGARTGQPVALSGQEKIDDLEAFMKSNKLSDKDIDISIEDAQTNAWMANAELEKFTKSHKQTIVDTAVADRDTKIKELKAEYEKAKQASVEAREFGDLSENEEYHAARNQMRQIQKQIDELENVGKKDISNGAAPAEKNSDIENITFSPDDIESYGATYGDYTLIKLKGYDDFIDDTDLGQPEAFNSIDYNANAALTEWYAFSKDEDMLQEAIEREMKKAQTAAKEADVEAEKAASKKVVDPDDSTKTTTYKRTEAESQEGILKKKATKQQWEAYQELKDHLEYSKNALKDLKSTKFYRAKNGLVLLADDSPNLQGYATYQNQLLARGWKPTKSADDVPALDAKADKKARKQMNKAMTANQNAGNIIDSRVQDFRPPTDKNGNIVMDNISRISTINNMEEIFRQIKEASGLEITRDGLLMRNEYADLLTRISDESVQGSLFRRATNAMTTFAKSVQNIQLAGGVSFMNALTIAQMRGAILQNPRAVFEYVKVAGSMRNSAAVKNFAMDNMSLFAKFVMETGDTSIVDHFGAALSTLHGVNDGGVTQNIITNLTHLKKDFVEQKVKANGNIPKAFIGLVSKDVQNTLFEDATFMNAMPVLRGKMLVQNYDAAVNKLMKKFPNADSKIIERAAIQMSYAKTQAFFDPYSTLGLRKAGDVLDVTFSKKMRDFAATFTNSKAQPTLLDTISNFFFALRYKMMLAGRVYDGAISSIPTAIASAKSRGVKELTKDTLDDVVDTKVQHLCMVEQ